MCDKHRGHITALTNWPRRLESEKCGGGGGEGDAFKYSRSSNDFFIMMLHFT